MSLPWYLFVVVFLIATDPNFDHTPVCEPHVVVEGVGALGSDVASKVHYLQPRQPRLWTPNLKLQEATRHAGQASRRAQILTAENLSFGPFSLRFLCHTLTFPENTAFSEFCRSMG